MTVTSKRCSDCSELKPGTEFHRNGRNASGLHHRCKNCQRIWSAAYRERKRAEPRPEIAGQTRRCRDCGERKALADFYPNVLGNLGRESTCHQCTLGRARVYRLANPEKRRANALLALYKLTPDEFARIAAAQNGRCAICGRAPTNKPKSGGLHVDHCHKTGAVRGLLCTGCNKGLGCLGDDEDRLRSAIDYLRRVSPKLRIVGFET